MRFFVIVDPELWELKATGFFHPLDSSDGFSRWLNDYDKKAVIDRIRV